MSEDNRRNWKLSVHGVAVELQCAIANLHQPLGQMLDCFAETAWPADFTPAGGSILPYDPAQVLRAVSPTARRVSRTTDSLEIYEEDERFWVVDERWGMAEINILKGQWRSWILPNPKVSAYRCAEMAVLWPMAQVLRARGISLVPAASVVRDGWAALIISPFGIEPELTALVRDGYRVIGQRWTALREEDGRLALLHMPGCIERTLGPRLRSSMGEDENWIDLRREFRGAGQNHAFCDSVLIVESGRRPRAHLRCLDGAAALQTLRRAWPISELHPQRRFGQLPARLASACGCAQVQLSRSPNDLLALLHSLRDGSPHQLEGAPLSLVPSNERVSVAA